MELHEERSEDYRSEPDHSPLENEAGIPESEGSEEDSRISGKVKRTASRVAGSVSSVVKQALVARDHVLMVRVNDEALDRINDLKDAGLFKSRSEAAAYLIAEGIEVKRELFERIGERIRQIQDLRQELRSLAGESGIGSAISDDGDTKTD
ncbi:hypothetical protein BMS3Bbin04_00126 [bacterium BMS3Bbin04]|nr:hypothetical protein BMS3Bbin04_00126 [bacterium BMS3Bbin04]